MALWIYGLELVALAALIFCLVFSSIVIAFGEPSACDVQKSSEFFQRNPKVSDIIVSFTTMPRRLQSESFKRAVASMFDQSVRPQEIWLNVPHTMKRTGEAYVIPEWVNELPIRLNRCEDHGPATKFIPTLRHFQNTAQRILVCDDDNVLPSNLIEHMHSLDSGSVWTSVGTILTKTATHFVDRAWVGHVTRGRSVLNDILPTFRASAPPIQEFKEVEKRCHVVMGCSGYLVTPEHVDLECVADLDALPKEAFFVDDVVMSGCLARKGTAIKMHKSLTEARMTYDEIWQLIFPTAKTEALSATVNDVSQGPARHNDRTMYDHFAPWPALE